MLTRNGRANDVVFLAIGGLIGAGVAIFLAPQSGRKTRQDILQIGKVTKNKSERVLLDVGNRTSRIVSNLSEKLQDQANRVQQLAEETKNLIESGKAYLQKMSA
jgi:gas vesicle protein